MRKRNNRAHSTSYLTGGLQAICLRSPTLRCTVLRCIFFIPHWIRSVKLSCTENILTKQKTPRFVMNRGAMLRYKGLPECLSICELCVYCSCCTSTLLHLRLSQGMWQTAGNQNLIPAVLDCSLYRQKCNLMFFFATSCRKPLISPLFICDIDKAGGGNVSRVGTHFWFALLCITTEQGHQIHSVCDEPAVDAPGSVCRWGRDR